MQLDLKAGMAANYRGWTSAGLAVNLNKCDLAAKHNRCTGTAEAANISS